MLKKNFINVYCLNYKVEKIISDPVKSSLSKFGRLATKVNSLLPSPYPSDKSSHNHIAELVPSPAIKKTSLPVPLTESVYLIEDIRSLLKVLDI